jgi:hypothetical protein
LSVLELIAKIVIFGAGVALVAFTLTSAVKFFVLPRSVNTFLVRQLFINVNRIFQVRVRKARSYYERDRIMAMFAPVTLILLPILCLILVGFGYTLMYWALGIGSLLDAFRVSGSSLFTLGFAIDAQTVSLFLEFSEAAIGIILTALLIGYLPTMYSTFSRREVMVNMLEVRAGSPPSVVTMLTRIHSIRGLGYLHELWEQWEQWFAEVEESHTTLAPLVFFRSPQPERSWITAAGVVLDTASFLNAAVDIPHDAQADLTIRAGFLALRRIADFFRIEYDPNPQPTDPISIARFEFDQAYDELLAAGLPLKTDRDQAWRDYAGWRVNYDRVLLALAALTMAPYAPWVSDRSLPSWQQYSGQSANWLHLKLGGRSKKSTHPAAPTVQQKNV